MDLITELTARHYGPIYKDVEELQKPVTNGIALLTKHGFFDDAFCFEDEAPVEKVEFTVPRLSAEKIERNTKHSICVTYFKEDKVKAFWRSRGVDVDEVSCKDIMGHPTLRRALDHHMTLMALTSKYEDPDPTAFVAKMSKNDTNTPEVADTVNASYDAYGADFRVNYIPPSLAEDHTSAAAPSFYQMFLAVADAVQREIIEVDRVKDLVYLSKACLHLELFTGGSNRCVDVVYDILVDYKNLGYVKLVPGHAEMKRETLADVGKMVEAVSPGKPRRLGTIKSHMGITFQPGGYLLPTFLGFSDYLQELNIINATTPLAGGSAGSITAAMSVVYTLNRYEAMALVEGMLGNAMHVSQRGTLEMLVSEALWNLMLPGTYEAANNKIGGIQLNSAAKTDKGMEPRFNVHFDSNKDLITAIEASCNVPGFYKVGPVMYKGEDCYDGLFSVDTYLVGASKVAAKRTVRLIVMPVGYGRRIKKSLQNDVANSFLQVKEAYFVHYIRLKGLFSFLLQRRLEHAEAGTMEQWKAEIERAIKVYGIVNKGKGAIKTNAKEIDEWLDVFSRKPVSGGYSKTRDCKIVGLFKTVIAAEQALAIGRGSKKHAGGIKSSLKGINIMRTYADPKYPHKSSDVKFLSTPYTLIDWLEQELSLLDGTGNLSPTRAEQEIKILKSLLHNLAPPSYINYYFTQLPYLIPTPYTKVVNTIYAAKPSSPIDARYMFDVGRVTAFRWVIADYISFENWLNLRIRQLEEDPTMAGLSLRVANADGESDNLASGKLIHELQHKQLDECIDLMDPMAIKHLNEMFSKRAKARGLKQELFQLRNRLIRKAILYGVVDKHYTHILTHRHFWVN